MAKKPKSRKSSLETQTQKGFVRQSMAKPLLVLVVLVMAAFSTAFFLMRRNADSASTSANPSSVHSSKPVITPDGWIKGNPNAKTVLVEFGDFQCPSCAVARLKIADILKKHDRDLKVVFKHYPMQNVHRNAMLASLAAEAAGRQSKFWEMGELLFSRQADWSNVPDAMTFFTKYAAEIQLNLDKFRSDITDSDILNKVYRDVLEGQVAKVRSVPTFFLDGNMLERVKSDVEFQEIIDKAIQSAQ